MSDSEQDKQQDDDLERAIGGMVDRAMSNEEQVLAAEQELVTDRAIRIQALMLSSPSSGLAAAEDEYEALRNVSGTLQLAIQALLAAGYGYATAPPPEFKGG